MKAFLILLVLIIRSNCLFAQEDTYKTARVDGVLYKAIYNASGGKISILKSNGEIVSRINSLDYFSFHSFKFTDFNEDGYKDLLVEYISNVPGVCELLLYDERTKKFIQVKDFPDYPAPQRLKNTNLYYSYHRSGCADSNWDSDLFKIVNNKIIKIGNISGLDCGGKETGVFITKVRGSKEHLLKEYPISEIEKYKNYKWGFIEQYWKRNYRKFI